MKKWRHALFTLLASAGLWIPSHVCAEKFTLGSTLYTTQRDIQLRDGTTLGSRVLDTISRASTKVTWLGYDPSDADWSRIRVQTSSGVQEGFTATANLSSTDLMQQSVPAYVSNTTSPVSGLVVATAATRAFSEVTPATREYATRTSREEALRWLFFLSKLEQEIDLSTINQHQSNAGLKALPADTVLSPPLPPPQPTTVEIGAGLDESTDTRAVAERCRNFAMYPVTEQEVRQISEIALLTTASRYGGFFDARTQENFHLHKVLYTVAKAMSVHSMRPGPYRVSVLNTKEINAFSTPGGDLMVTRGLLEWIATNGNENWLALILGHEIKHVVTLDGLTPWKEAKMEICSQILSPKADAATQALRPAMEAAIATSCKGSLNLDHVTPLLKKKLVERYTERVACASYPEDAELLADIEGQRLSILSGYKPIHADLFAGLKQRTGFGNHPPIDRRIQNLDQWIADMRPSSKAFGFKDWPFSLYPLVPWTVASTEMLRSTALLPAAEAPQCRMVALR